MEPKAADDSDSGLILAKLQDGLVSVDKELSDHLKTHQEEGVEFIWKNCFSDWGFDSADVGGCIVAHHMGLGKSLTAIAILHTAMTNPFLGTERSDNFKSLILAPANVIRNWKNEIVKWTQKLKKPLVLFNLQKTMPCYRVEEVKKWEKAGGILLMSDKLFSDKHSAFIIKDGQPNILVLDEAHTMLKNSKTKMSKQLNKIRTKRKILLTGTPMQNNCTEFFHLVDFVRPGALGKDVKDFETKYRKPIEAGLPKDADDDAKAKSEKLQRELNELIKPFLHRKDKERLRSELPPFYDTLLYLQTSPVQDEIMRAYERHCKKEDDGLKNFFRKYHNIAPLLNHPVCVKQRAERGNKKPDGPGDFQVEGWLRTAKKKLGTKWEKLNEMRHSPKFIMAANILAFSYLELKEKVIVYTKCLKTLDLLCELLESKDWSKSPVSLSHPSFRGAKLGGFKKGKHFLRIDGSVESGKRGALVDKFNNDDKVRFFLISAEAGGIGVNLTAATRIVMMDNHFNPAVADQCAARAHRYGQKKQVHCYRFAIDGTLEAKVYARSVNKSGVASNVLDGECFTRQFTRKELADLNKTDCWVTCSKCEKERRLPDDQDPPEEDKIDSWVCADNKDPEYNDCSRPTEKKSNKNHVESDDPVLQLVRSVVNYRTRKTELVTATVPVERESSPGHDALQTSQKMKRSLDSDAAHDKEPNKRMRHSMEEHSADV